MKEYSTHKPVGWVLCRGLLGKWQQQQPPLSLKKKKWQPQPSHGGT
jgi:hypothetical protein